MDVPSRDQFLATARTRCQRVEFASLNQLSRDQLLTQMFMYHANKAVQDGQMYILFKQELPSDFIDYLRSQGYNAKNGQFIKHNNGYIDERYDFNEYGYDSQYLCFIDLSK